MLLSSENANSVLVLFVSVVWFLHSAALGKNAGTSDGAAIKTANGISHCGVVAYRSRRGARFLSSLSFFRARGNSVGNKQTSSSLPLATGGEESAFLETGARFEDSA